VAVSGGVLAAIAVAAGVLALCAGGGDEAPGAATDGAPRGVLFVDGQHVAPPYRIEADETRLRVNGAVVRETARATPQQRATRGRGR
jgi:hypothetical protein